jgi:hypothetical protein
MNGNHPKIIREKKTVEAMIQIFCHNKHDSYDLCPNCSGLLEYANKHLDRCPFQERKPTCTKCLIHCYEPSMRTKIKSVMRYSGPRMLTKHPVLALHHIIHGFKKPEKIPKMKS